MIGSSSAIRMLLFAVATSLFFSVGANAVASIALPDLPQFELSTGAQQQTGGAGATEAPSQSDDQLPKDGQSPAVAEFAVLLGGTTTTTGTSANAGIGLPVGILLHPTSNVGLNDPAASGWVSGENCLFLPTPPGNDLLRPPQV